MWATISILKYLVKIWNFTRLKAANFMLITILVVMTNSGIIIADWPSRVAKIGTIIIIIDVNLAWMKMRQINAVILRVIQWMPSRYFILISYYF